MPRKLKKSEPSHLSARQKSIIVQDYLGPIADGSARAALGGSERRALDIADVMMARARWVLGEDVRDLSNELAGRGHVLYKVVYGQTYTRPHPHERWQWARLAGTLADALSEAVTNADKLLKWGEIDSAPVDQWILDVRSGSDFS